MSNNQVSEFVTSILTFNFFFFLVALAGTAYGSWIVFQAINKLLIKLERKNFDLGSNQLEIKQELKRDLWRGAKIFLSSLGLASVAISLSMGFFFTMMDKLPPPHKHHHPMPEWLSYGVGIAFGIAMSGFCITLLIQTARRLRDTSNLIPKEFHLDRNSQA